MQDYHQASSDLDAGCCNSTTDPVTPPATVEYQVTHLDSLQLSKRLNISIKSLARMRQAGTGPRFMRIGARILYRMSDVLEYEQSRLYNAVGSPVVNQGDEP